jgi:hypothetical protein
LFSISSYSFSPPGLSTIKYFHLPFLIFTILLPLSDFGLTLYSLLIYNNISRVNWFLVVRLSQLYSSKFIFGSSINTNRFDNPYSIVYLHVELYLVLYGLIGYLDITALLVCSLLHYRVLWFRIEDYALVVYSIIENKNNIKYR